MSLPTPLFNHLVLCTTDFILVINPNLIMPLQSLRYRVTNGYIYLRLFYPEALGRFSFPYLSVATGSSPSTTLPLIYPPQVIVFMKLPDTIPISMAKVCPLLIFDEGILNIPNILPVLTSAVFDFPYP